MNILRRLVFVAFITTSSTGLFGCFYYSKDIQPAPVAVEPLPATSASVDDVDHHDRSRWLSKEADYNDLRHSLDCLRQLIEFSANCSRKNAQRDDLNCKT